MTSNSPPTAPLVIAVDGPAASGKGTIAKALANHYLLPFMDTGKLYRACGLAVRLAGNDPYDAEAAAEAARHLDDLGSGRDAHVVRTYSGASGHADRKV